LATNAGPIYVQDLDDGRRLGKLEDFAKIQKFYQASDPEVEIELKAYMKIARKKGF
jgi:trimethylamine:corrinoid methyltransferase-like protein